MVVSGGIILVIKVIGFIYNLYVRAEKRNWEFLFFGI